MAMKALPALNWKIFNSVIACIVVIMIVKHYHAAQYCPSSSIKQSYHGPKGSKNKYSFQLRIVFLCTEESFAVPNHIVLYQVRLLCCKWNFSAANEVSLLLMQRNFICNRKFYLFLRPSGPHTYPAQKSSTYMCISIHRTNRCILIMSSRTSEWAPAHEQSSLSA